MNLKKNNSTVKYTAISAAMLVMAATTSNIVKADPFTFTVDAIEQVGLNQIRPLVIGTALKLSAFATCELPPVASTADWTAGAVFTSVVATHNDISMTGGGCASTTGLDNNYANFLINGAGDASVTVTLTGGSSTDANKFTFEPSGMYDNNTSTSAAVALNIAGDTSFALDSNGEAALIIGGEITVGSALLAGDLALVGNYDIAVVYQ
jgi:hypothetical protein